MVYDETGRHVSTTTRNSGGTTDTVTYTRDASGAVVGLATTIGSTTTTVHYSSEAGIQFTMNASNTVTETTVSRPEPTDEDEKLQAQMDGEEEGYFGEAKFGDIGAP